MNRFSKDNWNKKAQKTLLNEQRAFIQYIYEISKWLGQEPDSFLMNLKDLEDTSKGLNYAEWYQMSGDEEIEIQFSFINSERHDTYWVLAISSGDGNEAGVDQELEVGTDPLPSLKRLLSEYSNDHESGLNDKTHVDLFDELIKRIADLKSSSSSDDKLDIWNAIKTIPDENKKHQLEQVFRDKVKACRKGLTKLAKIVKKKDGYHVESEEGKNLGGPYSSHEKAVKRLRQVEYFKHKGEVGIKRLVKKTWDEKGTITPSYVEELIDDALTNIEMAFHDVDKEMVKEYDHQLGDLCVGAVDYAISHLDGFKAVLPKETETALYSAVKQVGDKYNDVASLGFSDKVFYKLADDLAHVIKRVLLHGIHDNEEKPSEEHSLDELLNKISETSPNTPSDEIINLYNEIKSLPDGTNKQMLMDKLKTNTKRAFNKAMNRFSEDVWAQQKKNNPDTQNYFTWKQNVTKISSFLQVEPTLDFDLDFDLEEGDDNNEDWMYDSVDELQRKHQERYRDRLADQATWVKGRLNVVYSFKGDTCHLVLIYANPSRMMSDHKDVSLNEDIIPYIKEFAEKGKQEENVIGLPRRRQSNRFSKEVFSQTIGDPSWVGDPDHGKSKFDAEEGQGGLEQACRRKAKDMAENLVVEIWGDIGIGDYPDIPYKQDNGSQIDQQACENWCEAWWDRFGQDIIDNWIKTYTDSDTHFGENDVDEVFEDMNVEQEMMKAFAPAYALLLSKIANVSQNILERIKNYK